MYEKKRSPRNARLSDIIPFSLILLSASLVDQSHFQILFLQNSSPSSSSSTIFNRWLLHGGSKPASSHPTSFSTQYLLPKREGGGFANSQKHHVSKLFPQHWWFYWTLVLVRRLRPQSVPSERISSFIFSFLRNLLFFRQIQLSSLYELS